MEAYVFCYVVFRHDKRIALSGFYGHKKRFMITLKQAEAVINELPEEFNSQDFLAKYRDKYEKEYLKGLLNYAIGSTDGFFQKYHSKIGWFLSKHKDELHIAKIERVRSINIHGNIAESQNWRKTL